MFLFDRLHHLLRNSLKKKAQHTVAIFLFLKPEEEFWGT